MRGFACVALHEPKSGHNVGGALRAASVYGADMIVLGGRRPKTLLNHPTDTMRSYRHIPTVLTENVFDVLPHDCVPVAVDLIPGARSLVDYVHPERAFYVFGPEDGTLGKSLWERCRDVVMIPTSHCMNLAATVNVVLYDRMAKHAR